MKNRVRATAAFAACAFLSACAATLPETAKEEPPGLSVRLPIADAATMNIESPPFPFRQELPLSVADETRGRWLILFEVNYTPAKPPPSLVPITENEPPR